MFSALTVLVQLCGWDQEEEEEEKEEARGGGGEEKQSEIERCGFTRGRKGREYVYEWILAHESAENNARVGWDFDRVVYEFRKVCV